MNISVVILTKNEEQDLPGCLKSVEWCDDINVFDSYSSDRTVEIAKSSNCAVTQRVFDNWSDHQNWGLKNINFKHDWVLYLDADERISVDAVKCMQKALEQTSGHVAFRIRRRDFFCDGTWLKHAQISPYFIRLFRPPMIQYERLVNPITRVNGTIGELSGYIDHYPFSKGIGFWMERHIRYATFEARMIEENRGNADWGNICNGIFSLDPNIRRHVQKAVFYKLPIRPILKAFYMLFIKQSFLDGRAGIKYTLLQTLYELLIVLIQSEIKFHEKKCVK